MDTIEQEQLRQSMHEALLLPVGDRKRRQIEAKIAKAGHPIVKEWLTLLRENDLLRLELMRISLPVELENSLLSIPFTYTHSRRPGAFWFLTSAIAILIAITISSFLWMWNNSSQYDNLHTLALLAMNDHVEEVHLEIETHDIRKLEQTLKKQLPFDVSLPNLGTELG